MAGFKTIFLKGKTLYILDQLRLPHEEVYLKARSGKAVYRAIKEMNLRGAPLIGVAAAYGVVVESFRNHNPDHLRRTIELLRSARPTAVNLNWALDRMARIIQGRKDLPSRLLAEARKIEKEDQEACIAMGRYGARLIRDGARILVHCNAGALATTGIGTALGVIYTAKEEGKRFQVFCTETRPYLQGARLTSWELKKNGITPTLICDSAVASLMPQIDLVIVGGDRIATNGDTANKIGTKTIAIVAHIHKVPFIVVAPISSIDPKLRDGGSIPIEYRAPDEITTFRGMRVATEGIEVLNPSFDVTPARYITAIVTERGIARPPFDKTIPKLL
ncbi:S-methyl-5-thioribose-1-phosphate isomerase [candidate division WOR-3 bacterium]|uniref:Methylthioribose-1-phosphate isomerase n=1 Tax=candidate division WOR-3 bacterium TaxID=2052148 RepID=A0A660SN85_UNCW3|nr:MAG: S-methyl-5-thioribose-1-phosphate isomerase [candidate division WOR-3 bacterium]